MLVSLFGALTGQGVVSYTGQFYALLQQAAGNNVVAVSSVKYGVTGEIHRATGSKCPYFRPLGSQPKHGHF